MMVFSGLIVLLGLLHHCFSHPVVEFNDKSFSEDKWLESLTPSGTEIENLPKVEASLDHWLCLVFE